MKKVWMFLIGLLCFVSSFSLRGGEKKALVYLLDGARADVMTNLQIPAWRMLRDGQWAAEYHTAWTLQGATCPDMEPSSGQNHTTAVTGLNGARHGMTTGLIFETYTGPVLPTFLEYLGERDNTFTSASFYGWSYDWVLRPAHGKFQLITAGDVGNSQILLRMLASSDCPDAIFVQDNDIDLWGHTNGFYPYSPRYEEAVQEAMERFEKALHAIRQRPAFPQEDWLIVLCSDHGGWARTHGKVGGHSSNIPLLVTGKHIPAGMMRGRYDLRDVTPWVLTHFGHTAPLADLDGKAGIQTENVVIRPETDGLIYENSAAKPLSAERVSVEQGEFTGIAGRRDFTLAFTIIPETGERTGNTVLVTNGRGQPGEPGFSLYMDPKGELRLMLGAKNAPRSFLVPESDRMELGSLQLAPGKKNAVVVAVTESGVVTMAHKAGGEPLYWFTCDSPGLLPVSGKPWIFGCAGSEHPAQGSWSDWKIWRRALTLPEIQSLTGAEQ